MQLTGKRFRRIVLMATWILAISPAVAQQDWMLQITGKPLIALNPDHEVAVPPLLFTKSFGSFALHRFVPRMPHRISGPEAIQPSFSLSDLAFFCRLEYKMEKALKFPVRIRLGEVQYVEEMEGKINSMRTNPSHRAYGPR